MSEKVRTVGIFLFLGACFFFPMPFMAIGGMVTALGKGDFGGAAFLFVMAVLAVLVNVWWYKKFRRDLRRYGRIDDRQQGRTGTGISR